MKGTPAVLSIHFRSWSKGLKEDHKTHHGPKPNSHLFRSAALGHRYTAEFQLECYPQLYLSKGTSADPYNKIVFVLAKDAHTLDNGNLLLQLDQPRGSYE